MVWVCLVETAAGASPCSTGHMFHKSTKSPESPSPSLPTSARL